MPRRPMNPFHEETYIIRWRRLAATSNGDSLENNDVTWPWNEKRASLHEDCEEVASGRLRGFLGDLPEHTNIEVSICAVNVRGSSEFSELCRTRTLLRPEDGGSRG